MTAPIALLDHEDKEQGLATGFFYQRTDSQVYFVTNWHVVTGRNPKTPGICPKDKNLPCKIRLKLHRKTDLGQFSTVEKIVFDVVINDRDWTTPRWLEHPRHGARFDVVAIEIDSSALRRPEFLPAFATIGECDLSPGYQEKPMDDAFVIGYPGRLSGGSESLPLYKRGTIASEPLIAQSQVDSFLIDCRATEGMSGSPVICSHSGIWSPSGEFDQTTTLGTTRKFVGVYSGRLYEAPGTKAKCRVASEIGIVWKAAALDELVAARKPAKTLMELL